MLSAQGYNLVDNSITGYNESGHVSINYNGV